MMAGEYTSYPEGFNKLMNKLVPWYMGPMRSKMIKLFLTIITDG